MVDPIFAKDGHTYKRSAIEEWLHKNHTSPVIPSKRLKMSYLTTNKTVQETIETLVETGAVEDELVDSWKEKKKEVDLIKETLLFEKYTKQI